MLSASAAPDSIATAIDLLKQSQFSQAQQQHIEHTISAIAHQHHWPRPQAAQWLHNQAFR